MKISDYGIWFKFSCTEIPEWYSSDIDKLYLYLREVNLSRVWTTIFLDGSEISAMIIYCDFNIGEIKLSSKNIRSLSNSALDGIGKLFDYSSYSYGGGAEFISWTKVVYEDN